MAIKVKCVLNTNKYFNVFNIKIIYKVQIKLPMLNNDAQY